MDILALAPRNHSRARVYVLSIRLLAVSCYSFFGAPLSRRCIRIPFSFRNPISGRCPVFPWISAAPNLLISRLLLSHSFPALPSSSLPLARILSRYRSFQPNTVNYFFPFFLSRSRALSLSLSVSFPFFGFLFLSLQ